MVQSGLRRRGMQHALDDARAQDASNDIRNNQERVESVVEIRTPNKPR